MDRQAGVLRSLHAGRLPIMAARTLRALRTHGKQASVRVIGTNALYAYESLAGVVFNAASTATGDVDILVDDRNRLRLLAEHAPLIATVVLANMALLAISALLFLRYDIGFALSELGILNSMDALQLLAAGLIGLAVFRAFWRQPAARLSPAAAPRCFLWGPIGPGLVPLAFADGSRTDLNAHTNPELSAIQSPRLRGSGMPVSIPNMTSIPPRPNAIDSQRTGVMISPATTRASRNPHIGIR